MAMRLAVNQEMCRFESCPQSQIRAARCMVHGLPYKQRKFQIGAQAEFESQRGHHAGVVVW